jgi:competence protein ComEA
VKKELLLIAFGVVVSLLGSGIVFLTSRPPRGNAIQLLPPPTQSLLVFQVSGAVVNPGIYELPIGSRMRDAIQAAGGFTLEANQTGVNQAALLEDGQSIIIQANPPIPTQRSPSTPEPTAGIENPLPATTAAPPGGDLPASTATYGWININTATLEELDRLPGIGPVIAQRIIDYRTSNGPFVLIEDIMNVKGIGPVTFEKIKGLITVSP